MKKKGGFFIVNLVILAIGVLFIAASKREDFVQTLVYFLGVIFIVPGVLSIIELLRDNNREDADKKKGTGTKRFFSWVCSVAAIVLGLTMCFFPDVFKDVVINLFGVTLIIGAFYHLFMLIKGTRPAKMPMWLAASPVLLVAGGCWILFGDLKADVVNHKTVILILGIGLMLFAVTSFIEMICVKAYFRKNPVTPQGQTPADYDHRLEN